MDDVAGFFLKGRIAHVSGTQVGVIESLQRVQKEAIGRCVDIPIGPG